MVLWRAVAVSYGYADWELLPDRDWGVFEQLTEKADQRVDHQMLTYIWRFAPHNNNLALALLKKMSRRGDEAMLQHIAQVLAIPNAGRSGWAVEIKTLDDYLAIVRNFERMSRMDFETQELLSRVGEYDPIQLIQFSSAELRLHLPSSLLITWLYRQRFPRLLTESGRVQSTSTCCDKFEIGCYGKSRCFGWRHPRYWRTFLGA